MVGDTVIIGAVVMVVMVVCSRCARFVGPVVLRPPLVPVVLGKRMAVLTGLPGCGGLCGRVPSLPGVLRGLASAQPNIGSGALISDKVASLARQDGTKAARN